MPDQEQHSPTSRLYRLEGWLKPRYLYYSCKKSICVSEIDLLHRCMASLFCDCRFDLFLFLELAHIQVVVKALLAEQFVVFAALDNLAVFDHQDDIGIADGTQTVRDHEAGAPFEQLLQRL